MTRLDPADQLAALMRAQIATLRQQAGAKPAARRQPPARGAAAAKPADPVAQAAQRIRAIDPADPDRKRKAVRAFLECILVAELGSRLVSDPGFGQMVDHIEHQLQSDPELAAATAEAADILLKSSER